jgi:hypothetical protein
MMQLSGLSRQFRLPDWTKSIADIQLKNILQNVERAGFLASYSEQESGLFCLYGLSWLEWHKWRWEKKYVDRVGYCFDTLDIHIHSSYHSFPIM